MRKILFVTLTLAPYKVKWMEALSNDFEVNIYYTRYYDKERHPDWLIKSSNKINLIKGIDVFSKKFLSFDLFKYIWFYRYENIIFDGYGFLTQFMGLLMCRILSIDHFINIDGGIRVENENILMVILKKILISKKSKYLASSIYTKEYLMNYGVPSEKIYIHPFTSLVQNDILKDEITDEVKRNLRLNLNLGDKFQIICVSQTIYRKGIDVLLVSLNQLNNVHLTVIGGKCTKEYEQIIKKFNLSVNFIEYLSYDQLKEYYQAADLFVLPTRYDVWGLVVNEAMANGLPVVTTKKCGAGLALVDHEFLVDPDDSLELSNIIMKIQQDDKLRKKLSKQSLTRIQSYSIENVAQLHRKLFGVN